MSMNAPPMTTSTTQPNNAGTSLFLRMIMINKKSMSTKDSFSTKNKIIDHFDAKSVHSQSTAATDASSVVSNDDSTLASQPFLTSERNGATPGSGRSALKRENGPSRRRLPQGHIGIQFNSSVQQQQHLALHEYTTEELNACWLRKNEYAQITRSCLKEIKMLDRGFKNLVNDDRRKYSARGLESHTRLAALARNQTRLAAWGAVFDEQRDQLSLGVIDDEAIASRYRDATSSSKLWAIRVGQQDEKVAELVYDLMAH